MRAFPKIVGAEIRRSNMLEGDLGDRIDKKWFDYGQGRKGVLDISDDKVEDGLKNRRKIIDGLESQKGRKDSIQNV